MHAFTPEFDAVRLRLIWVFQLILQALSASPHEPDLRSDENAREIESLIRRIDEIILMLTEATERAIQEGRAGTGARDPGCPPAFLKAPKATPSRPTSETGRLPARRHPVAKARASQRCRKNTLQDLHRSTLILSRLRN